MRENNNALDGFKLLHDTFKHLATLGSGSIVILGALAGKTLPLPSGQYWGLLLGFLFISVSCSTVTMFAIATFTLRHAELSDDDRQRFRRKVIVAVYICIISYLIGLSPITHVLTNLF